MTLMWVEWRKAVVEAIVVCEKENYVCHVIHSPSIKVTSCIVQCSALYVAVAGYAIDSDSRFGILSKSWQPTTGHAAQ
jgi:hypothetical protein